ncbi:MAG: nitrogenase [Lentisphaerae bacterium]|nr:nitrogenase [Lentisphaerota bacterium]
MLKALVNKNIDQSIGAIAVGQAAYPQPFRSELEFNAPARGMWNIVHTGMLIPQSHQIFVCAQGCLRGVILTAAEMNAMDRMSFVTVQEQELFDGTMERNIVEGTAAILDRMAKPPRAVLLFLSCIQLFAGCDLKSVFAELRNRYKHIDFIECLMHPTMRKNQLTPDQFMRRQLYAMLRKTSDVEPRTIGIIGNDRATAESSELIRFLRSGNYGLRDITLCRNYDEYLSMARCGYFISYLTTARAANEFLSQRLGRPHLHLPLSYNADEIRHNYQLLGDMLELDVPDFAEDSAAAEAALRQAYKVIRNRPVAIDYTATLRSLSLARLLLDNGFNVERIYTDVIIGEEADDFTYLQQHYPQVMLYPTLHPRMRFAVMAPGSNDDFIAIGQKAACYTGTSHLVNIVSGGGWYGFDGIRQLAQAMQQAALNRSDVKTLIQHKGWGCESCL